ncbi:uncharacterized protein MYCFIDRAFT_209338 [Pseudocercospora fijiensis CIRAD86]|uniref:Uncharacterized protein n=1 Tax=Pseudocercospora fijiensis (strain CIRAD86) TaxID=383855 RepID=M3AIT8_PSEFD|nr:uncharacterized protein MYCFIDRAFT_209338 [Pseudocercospora fijiensis CIRAD86]EME77382.1 hypothetical protein MYCFIDRAFT_209338 [Pseudocercospora fijiensis CIRAD86]
MHNPISNDITTSVQTANLLSHKSWGVCTIGIRSEGMGKPVQVKGTGFANADRTYRREDVLRNTCIELIDEVIEISWYSVLSTYSNVLLS